MAFTEANWLAILIAGIVSFVIGALWYSPLFFGRAWMRAMKLSGKDMQKHKKGMGWRYLTAFISAIVMACVLSILINAFNASGFTTGMIVGFLAWLGFVATIGLGSILWEGKPFELYLINMLYWLIALLVAGGILGSWS